MGPLFFGGFVRDERGLCELCGQEWCGRPCLNDPKRSNALLFHADGRVKTLRERGLGLTVEEMEAGRRRAAGEHVTETPPPDVTKTSSVTETPSKGGRPKKEGGAMSVKERVARLRARLKGEGE